MDAELLERIMRLRSAFGAAYCSDIKRLPARIHTTPNGHIYYQDFGGGKSQAEITNLLHSLLYNLGSFRDHLQDWGEARGISRASIANYLAQSVDYCVIIDLYNRDKHGPPGNRKGLSGRAPYLGSARSCMRLRTHASNGSWVGLQANPNGGFSKQGDGFAEVVITADCLDKNGNSLGGICDIARRAIQYCEVALKVFNVRGQ